MASSAGPSASSTSSSSMASSSSSTTTAFSAAASFLGAAFLSAFFAAAFLGASFLAAGFFAAAFLAGAFLAGAFFSAFSAVLAALAVSFFAVPFFAGAFFSVLSVAFVVFFAVSFATRASFQKNEPQRRNLGCESGFGHSFAIVCAQAQRSIIAAPRPDCKGANSEDAQKMHGRDAGRFMEGARSPCQACGRRHGSHRIRPGEMAGVPGFEPR